jgi:hypothetical protein
MIEIVKTQIDEILRIATDNYGVNPIIFLIIYLICVPIFYYSLFRTLQALAKRVGKEIILWSAIFLSVNVAPFIYVIIFGQNIPWWVYIIITILIGQAVISLIMKLKRKPIIEEK